ncbi:6619_t:CDS:2, partial [Gigaspora margarita]
YMNELMTLQTASTGREKYFRKFPNDSIIDFYDLDGKGVAFHDNYKFWKFNRQILSHSIKSACLSSETSRTINNLFEEMANYWINLKKPDDSIIIDVPVWMRRFINEFMSTVTTGNRTFAIKYYYQKLKNEITNEILESQKFIDSTATTVTFALYNISHHPNVKKKLCEEIDAVFKDDPTRP